MADADYEALEREALAQVAAADSPAALEQVRVALPGKKGRITAELKNLGRLPAAERPQAGAASNRVKQALGEASMAAPPAGRGGGAGCAARGHHG